VIVLANTPLSLFKGLVECSGMNVLRKTSPDELVEYFDHITARHKPRSEVVVALAYAVLCAILLHARNANQVPVNASRLLWGERIRNHMSRNVVSNPTISIHPSQPRPEIRVIDAPPAVTPTLLLGQDGRAIIWRNEE
jgi:hypothetical protein